jgi:hypothetical protein
MIVVLATLFMSQQGLYLRVPDFREQQAVLTFDLTHVSVLSQLSPASKRIS